MRRHGPRGLLLAAVLLAHFGLVVSIVHLTRVRPRPVHEPSGHVVTWLRLLREDRPALRSPDRDDVRHEKVDDAHHRPPSRQRLGPIAEPPGQARDVAPPDTRATVGGAPQAITLPEALSSPAVPTEPDRTASSPLDLRWRNPGSPSPAAAARSRDRPGRLTLGQRLDRDLGTAEPLTQETTAMGHRYRSGGGCVEVRPSRASGLDPFNASVQPTPKQASRC